MLKLNEGVNEVSEAQTFGPYYYFLKIKKPKKRFLLNHLMQCKGLWKPTPNSSYAMPGQPPPAGVGPLQREIPRSLRASRRSHLVVPHHCTQPLHHWSHRRTPCAASKIAPGNLCRSRLTRDSHLLDAD